DRGTSASSTRPPRRVSRWTVGGRCDPFLRQRSHQEESLTGPWKWSSRPRTHKRRSDARVSSTRSWGTAGGGTTGSAAGWAVPTKLGGNMVCLSVPVLLLYSTLTLPPGVREMNRSRPPPPVAGDSFLSFHAGTSHHAEMKRVECSR